jgi:hypothetical protein
MSICRSMNTSAINIFLQFYTNPLLNYIVYTFSLHSMYQYWRDLFLFLLHHNSKVMKPYINWPETTTLESTSPSHWRMASISIRSTTDSLSQTNQTAIVYMSANQPKGILVCKRFFFFFYKHSCMIYLTCIYSYYIIMGVTFSNILFP